jgi:hypothetical protein
MYLLTAIEKLLHQVDDLFELNVKLRCQKVNETKCEDVH